MRYLLINLGLLVGGFGAMFFATAGAGAREQGLGLLLGVVGGMALVVGLATCDIVAAIRERHPPQ
jgi:hypothetical protein